MLTIESVRDTCTGCSACYNVCPKDCIEMKKDPYGFIFPNVNSSMCIDCHQCENVCVALKGCDEILNDNTNSKYYAAWASKDCMEKRATSGGVASVLSNNFLKNGAVFGAAFSKGITGLAHIECRTEADIKAISGSKYLQSDTSESFHRVKELLNSGEKVLYVGMPCQIAGLKKYLKIDFDNLYTIDFFCHGVPTPLAWEKFVQHLENKYHAKLVSYNFRAKIHGWGKIEQSAKFSHKRFFLDIGRLNAFHLWFGRHLSIRNSCFRCKFRREQRASDITLADFWNIEQYYPDIPTKQGVSAVILNTDHGKALFYEAVKSKQLVACEVSYESIWEKRKTTQQNYEEPAIRKAFLEDLRKLSDKDFIKKYPPQTILQLLVEKILIEFKQARRKSE